MSCLEMLRNKILYASENRAAGVFTLKAALRLQRDFSLSTNHSTASCFFCEKKEGMYQIAVQALCEDIQYTLNYFYCIQLKLLNETENL